MTVEGGISEPVGGSCIRIVARENVATAVWTAAAPAFALEPGGPRALRNLRVGVLDRPAAPIALSPPTATGPLGPVRLPALPAGLRWAIMVEVAAGEAVTVCCAVGD